MICIWLTMAAIFWYDRDYVKPTERRPFAASVNLKHDFDGGKVSFSEFGSPQFKATIGAAVT
jgi:hypothetical protein